MTETRMFTQTTHFIKYLKGYCLRPDLVRISHPGDLAVVDWQPLLADYLYGLSDLFLVEGVKVSSEVNNYTLKIFVKA